MKVAINDTLVQIISDIPAEYGSKRLVAKDEEGNEKYLITRGLFPEFTKFTLICNTVVDGKLACAFFTEEPMTQEDFKHVYVEEVMSYKEWGQAALQSFIDGEAAVDAVFEDIFA